jgi:hypothetical protein
MKPEDFKELLHNNSDKDYGLCPPPIKAQKALNILVEHFLGKDWYVTTPMGQEQVNSEAVYEILRKTQPSLISKIFG